jgi:hypothetical protein
MSQYASDNHDEDEDLSQTLSVEFTLLSGETITVRDALDEPPTEEAVRRYAQQLIDQLGTDTVRAFAYWWEDEFYVDAVRLREVAALSVSTVTAEDDSDEWDA